MSVQPPRRELSAVEPTPGLREALDAARAATPAPQRLAAAREALLLRAAGLDPNLALQGAKAANAANAANAVHVTKGETLSLAAGRGALSKMVLGALGGAVVSAAVVWQLTAPVPPVPPSEVQTAPAPTTDLEPPEMLQAPPKPEPTVVPAKVEDDAAPEQERTQARPSRRRVRHARASQPKPPAQALPESSANTLRREVSLLSLARDALQDRPRETLRLTAEHQRLFPNGRFVQEREVLAVHALLRRGEREAGVLRGEQFLTRYPHSTHAQRVAGLLEGARR